MPKVQNKYCGSTCSILHAIILNKISIQVSLTLSCLISILQTHNKNKLRVNTKSNQPHIHHGKRLLFHIFRFLMADARSFQIVFFILEHPSSSNECKVITIIVWKLANENGCPDDISFINPQTIS